MLCLCIFLFLSFIFQNYFKLLEQQTHQKPINDDQSAQENDEETINGDKENKDEEKEHIIEERRNSKVLEIEKLKAKLNQFSLQLASTTANMIVYINRIEFNKILFL